MGTTTPKRNAKSTRFDSRQQEAYLALWRTYDRLRTFEDDLFARWELTAQQYNVLRLLRASHPDAVPTLSLVARMVSRAPDVTRMLDKLETAGRIVRTRSLSDRRTVLVGLAESGFALLDEIAEPLRACHEKQLGHLSSTELSTLIALLKAARGPHETAESVWR